MDRIDLKRVQILGTFEDLNRGQGEGELVVEQIMTALPSCVSVNTSVLELVRMIHAKAFRHLLVTNEQGELVGVISDRDVLRHLGPGAADKEKLSQITAGDLMSRDLLTIRTHTPIMEAIGIMIDQGISCLPVLEQGRLVGIMTNTDLHILLQMMLQAVRLTVSAKPAASSVR